jgi:hypothetical protein
MSVKATCLVGLDVHARQTHAAVVDLRGGELTVRRVIGAPGEVLSFLETLPGPLVAVYEAGPTGFGLARLGRSEGCARDRAGVDSERAGRPSQDRPA